jgi:hypothetical protein
MTSSLFFLLPFCRTFADGFSPLLFLRTFFSTFFVFAEGLIQRYSALFSGTQRYQQFTIIKNVGKISRMAIQWVLVLQ